MFVCPYNYELNKIRKRLPVVDSFEKKSSSSIFSSAVFGVTEEELQTKSALINLGCYVFRPLVLQAFSRINRKYVQCATSTGKEFYFRKGVLYEVDETYQEQPDDVVGYGPVFLYNNWNNIDKRQFKQEHGRISNKELKLSIAKLTRDQLFTNYIYVIALAFRSENLENGRTVNDWNVLYSEIIRASNQYKMMKAGVAGVRVDLRDMESIIQKAVLDLGDYIKDTYFGPHGIGREEILSRNVDNGARMVIIPTVWKEKKLRQARIGMRASGVPIQFLLPMFKETIIKFSYTLIEDLFNAGLFEPRVTRDFLAYYDIEFLSNAITNMSDPHFRVTDFPAIKYDGSFTHIKLTFIVDEDGTETKVTKPLSWTEFFYIVVETYAKLYDTRMIAITRPPVDSMTSLQPQRPVCLTLSPNLTKKVTVMNNKYNDFPLITEQLKARFQDQIFDSGSRLVASISTGMNADHDKFCPVYSKECAEKAC